jgi:hypothetical protein
LVIRCLVIVILAGCLHAPPFVGTGDDDDAGIIIMDAPVDADSDCPGGITIGYSNALVLVTPPGCANKMTIDAYGASGGAARLGLGGKGGHVTATMSTAFGQSYFVSVGGMGGKTSASNKSGAGGYNGGGDGGNTNSEAGGGGGGATDIRTTSALADRIVVAGAGGGATSCTNGSSAVGGDGGSPVGGEPGLCPNASSPPTPGGQSPPGSGLCNGAAGALGQGGQGCSSSAGGGGGGGYYGGGGGLNTGGAGGSSYVSVTAMTTLNTSGANMGDGHVVITWDHIGPQQ